MRYHFHFAPSLVAFVGSSHKQGASLIVVQLVLSDS